MKLQVQARKSADGLDTAAMYRASLPKGMPQSSREIAAVNILREAADALDALEAERDELRADVARLRGLLMAYGTR